MTSTAFDVVGISGNHVNYELVLLLSTPMPYHAAARCHSTLENAKSVRSFLDTFTVFTLGTIYKCDISFNSWLGWCDI